jgi:membrane associated rhomboid family serine protease
VSGVIIAYLILYPHVRVLGLVLNILPLRIPAIFALSAWIILQIYHALAGGDAEVGWWAHLGGLLAGAMALPLLVRPGTRLLGRDIPVLGKQAKS